MTHKRQPHPPLFPSASREPFDTFQLSHKTSISHIYLMIQLSSEGSFYSHKSFWVCLWRSSWWEPVQRMLATAKGLTALTIGCLCSPHRKWLPANSDQIHCSAWTTSSQTFRPRSGLLWGWVDCFEEPCWVLLCIVNVNLELIMIDNRKQCLFVSDCWLGLRSEKHGINEKQYDPQYLTCFFLV